MLLAPGNLVLSGYSAAALLGVDCAPVLANAEITVPGGDFREQPGLTVHRDLLADDEVTAVDGIPVTTRLRTAWDLARWRMSGGFRRAGCGGSTTGTRGRDGDAAYRG